MPLFDDCGAGPTEQTALAVSERDQLPAAVETVQQFTVACLQFRAYLVGLRRDGVGRPSEVPVAFLGHGRVRRSNNKNLAPAASPSAVSSS